VLSTNNTQSHTHTHTHKLARMHEHIYTHLYKAYATLTQACMHTENTECTLPLFSSASTHSGRHVSPSARTTHQACGRAAVGGGGESMCVCVGRSLSGVGHCMLGKGVLLCKGCAAVSYKTLCCCGDSCAAFAVQQSSLCAGRCVVLLAMCGRGVLLYRRGVSVCVCVCERERL